MKPSRIYDVLTSLRNQKWPAFLWGPPGVGKSAIVKKLAESANLPVIDLRASLLDPTDLRGIPAISEGHAIWCPPDFLPKASDKPGILFLDEINAAPPLVQASLYQLVLDRQIGEYKLPDQWWIVAAGNRQGDQSVVFRLSAALANRFIHLDFDADILDWRNWGIDSGLHPMILAFIAFRPNLLLGDPTPGSPAYPTPRSWHMLSDVITTLGGIENVSDVAPGIIGEAAAIEFKGYIQKSLSEKDYLEIVADPSNTKLPTELGDIYALTSWFAYGAKEEIIRAAASTLLSRLPPEFGVVMARDMVKGSITFINESGYKKFIKKHGKLFVS
jgi:hypothetical protein